MERRERPGAALGPLKRACLAGSMLMALAGTAVVPAAAQDATTVPALAPTAAAMDAVAVVERVASAVVTVNNLQQSGGGLLGGGDPQRAGVGTGFVLDEQGYVVTNEHVVRGGDDFVVLFSDGAERPAELIGADPLSDLAVVRVEGDLPATVALGDSEALRVGQPVLALGSPLGAFTNTVTQGIVSALNRDFPLNDPCAGTYDNLIQHDAAINPGNSGGPLFDAAGEVVGVNTLGIPGAQGLFFAVPATTVREITAEIIETGEVTYPLLGIEGVAITGGSAGGQALPVDAGHFISAVAPNGPAADAGLRANDIVVAIGGQRIGEQTTLTEALFAHEPGETIEVTVRRGEEEISAPVTLDRREQLLDPRCFSENIVP